MADVKVLNVLLSSEYKKAAYVAFALQIPITIISFLVLDMGQMSRICLVALIGFWSLALIIAGRRPWAPTSADLLYWRWGFVLCYVTAFVFGTIKINL
jgi:hypothetical protein